MKFLYKSFLMGQLLLAVVQSIPAQTTSRNYVHTSTMLNESGTQSLDVIQYYDGLGRPEQQTQKAITSNGADLVTLLDYDTYGRESVNWLPIPTQNGTGSYRDPDELKSRRNTIYGSDSIYSRTYYEASPLNRVAEQYGPGRNWYLNHKRVTTEYLNNVGSSGELSCKWYSVGGTAEAPIVERTTLNYPDHFLQVKKISDEDDKVLYEFTNRKGQLILQRHMDNNDPHDTYYVYDDFGNLCFVIPPMGADQMVGLHSWDEFREPVRNYLYLYRYDEWNRCIAKRLPGADWIYYVYDRAGRLILSQDGNQRSQSPQVWTFNIYDKKGRLIMFGEYPESRDHTTLINEFKTRYVVEEKESMFPGYTLNTMPNVEYRNILQINYYDDPTHFQNQLNQVDMTEYGFTQEGGYSARHLNSTGLLVGIFDYTKELPTAYYYDNRGRIVQKKTGTLLGMDTESFLYSFDGRILKRKLFHSVIDGMDITEVYSYDYDHGNRLTQTRYKINSEPEILMWGLDYDELGRIHTKRRMDHVPIQYLYSTRGWITAIMYGDYFMQFIMYENTTNTYDHCGFPLPKYYNGNISCVGYGYSRETFDAGHVFEYDGLNRMTLANSLCLGTPYYEFASYDKNGNVKELYRGGVGETDIYDPDFDYHAREMDILDLNYNENQLIKVTDYVEDHNEYHNFAYFTDGANLYPEYLYDKNGNMTTDYNKGISKIEYNHLNLPVRMQMKEGHMAEYYYDASGTKYREIYKTPRTNLNIPMSTIVPLTAAQTSITEDILYVGNKKYIKNGSNYTLRQIYTEEGTVSPVGTGWQHVFYLKDYQGNIRSGLSAETGGNFSCRHYFPSGVEFTLIDNATSSLERYAGKDLKRYFGMNYYDFGARLYDPSLMRWHVMDPLAENNYSVSPYAYCSNNPVNRIDPSGLTDYLVNDEGYVQEKNPFMNAIKGFLGIKDETDQLIASNGNSLVMESGTMGKVQSYSQGNKLIGHYFNVADNNAAKQIFEFVSENTNVEWGRVKVESLDKKNNVISTSHTYNTENVMSKIAINMMDRGYPVVELTHSHPSGGLPSGFGIGHDNVGDKKFVNYLNNRYPDNFVTHKVYDVLNKQYIYYNNSNIYRYENK